MSVEWRDLKKADFSVRPGTYQGPSAEVIVDGEKVVLQIDDETVTTEIEHLFKSIIGYWIDNREKLAEAIEEHVQTFLNGKNLNWRDLLLFDITICCDDENQEPNFCSLSLTIGGEYGKPGYKLDQFDSDSCVEISANISNLEVEWSELDIDTSNYLDD